MKEPSLSDTGICACLWKLHETPEYKHPLGIVGHYLGGVMLLSFIVVILPLFIVTWISSSIYFWFYTQKSISPKPFFHFDRHNIKHLSLFDKFGCEYCEFTNGTLQWALAIANEVEKRWCPIKNKSNAHCEKPKKWRKDFVNFEHTHKDLENYYQNKYSDT